MIIIWRNDNDDDEDGDNDGEGKKKRKGKKRNEGDRVKCWRKKGKGISNEVWECKMICPEEQVEWVKIMMKISFTLHSIIYYIFQLRDGKIFSQFNHDGGKWKGKWISDNIFATLTEESYEFVSTLSDINQCPLIFDSTHLIVIKEYSMLREMVIRCF